MSSPLTLPWLDPRPWNEIGSHTIAFSLDHCLVRLLDYVGQFFVDLGVGLRNSGTTSAGDFGGDHPSTLPGITLVAGIVMLLSIAAIRRRRPRRGACE